MRLFVAVVPPEDVLDQMSELVAALREEHSGSGERHRKGRVRWASQAQWHVTLRFLGEVADPAEVVEALDCLHQAEQLDGSGEASRSDRSGQADGTSHGGDPHLAGLEAELRMRPKVLGGSVLCLPVQGLDELAQAVTTATAHIGQPPEPRPFRGHVTVARLRGRRGQRRGFGNVTTPRSGKSAAVCWAVSEVHVMRSHLHRDGSRYEILSTMPLS